MSLTPFWAEQVGTRHQGGEHQSPVKLPATGLCPKFSDIPSTSRHSTEPPPIRATTLRIGYRAVRSGPARPSQRALSLVRQMPRTYVREIQREHGTFRMAAT